MFAHELRHAFRALRRQPLLTAVAVITLTLGIGANTAIFSIVDGVLLRPLPLPEPGRLVRVYQTYDVLRDSPNPRLQAIWDRLPMSFANARDLRRRSATLAAVGLFRDAPVVTDLAGEPVRLPAARIDAGLLAVLGVEPTIGRGFEHAEVERGERLAIVGHGLWREALGGDEGVLGRVLRLDDESYEIVGVMPPGFGIPGRDDRLWLPLRPADDERELRDYFYFSALARLAPGVELESAKREAARIGDALAAAYPEADGATGIRLVPLLETLVGDSRPLLHLLLAAVAVVLLVACVNVAHLLLVRTASRRRELAIRAALGAGRGRLIRQLLLESVLLGLAGGGGGLLLAVLARDLLLAQLPAELPRAAKIAIDVRVLVFTLAVSLAAALVSGLLPAFAGTRARSRLDPGGGAPPRRGLLAHEGFAVLEIALTLTLTVTAALLGHSFLRLSAVDPGFRVEGLLVQQIELPEWRYPETHRRAAFARELLAGVARLPGVESAALTTKLPFAGPAHVWGFRIPGRDADDGESWTRGRSASMKFVSPYYFRTLGVAILQGRVFTAADRPESGPVVIVNRTLAERHWPAGDAVGSRVVMGGDDTVYEVVGIAADIRHDGLDAAGGELMYQPWSQGPATMMTAVVAVGGDDPLTHAPALRRALRVVDPTLPLAPATTVEELLAHSLHGPRSVTVLVALLAALALALALIGTFAVTSVSVDRRMPEIGVRMALGASAARVRALILFRTLSTAGAGIVLGLAAAPAAAGLLRSLLYGVAPYDPRAYLVAAGVLGLASFAAGLLPAHRAGRADPARILRRE